MLRVGRAPKDPLDASTHTILWPLRIKPVSLRACSRLFILIPIPDWLTAYPNRIFFATGGLSSHYHHDTLASMLLRRCLLAASLLLASAYVIADIHELWQIFQTPNLPLALQSYHTSVAWSEGRRFALTSFSLRVTFGAVSLCGLVLFLRSNHIYHVYLLISHLLYSSSEFLRTAAFWGWWTLLGYVYEAFGLNTSGWRINSRPLAGRIWYELPMVLVSEVALALIFVWLRRKCSRPVAWFLFTLVGIIGWTTYQEIQIRWRLRQATSLVSLLEAQGQRAELKRLRTILRVRGDNFPEERVFLGRVSSATYVKSLTQEAILYNHSQRYDGWGETEAVLVAALYDRSLGRTWKMSYALSWTMHALRGLMAYGVGSLPEVSNVFGISPQDIQVVSVLSLAIGDFLMGNLQYILEPACLWLSRANQRAEDEATAQAGYAAALVMAISRTSVALEYELAPLYEMLRSGKSSLKKRIERINAIKANKDQGKPLAKMDAKIEVPL